MSIDALPVKPELTLTLDDRVSEEEIQEEIEAAETENRTFLYLMGSVAQFSKIKTALCALRASGMAGLLVLDTPPSTLSRKELRTIADFLRDWDQLFLANLVQLAGDRIPKQYQERLAAEVKLEMKCFQEWFIADTNAEVHQMPGLPWRSYIRKVISENSRFFEALLAVDESGEQSGRSLEQPISQFLEKRKQVLCVFPKRFHRRN